MQEEVVAKGSRWTRDEVSRLLCTLNINIEPIHNYAINSKPSLAELRAFALPLLCQKYGSGCSSLRIRSKLEHLWDKMGDPEASKEMTPLLMYGAFSRTLPGLDGLHPGLLNEIASKVRQIQEQELQSELAQAAKKREDPKATRKSSRNNKPDVVRCGCGFTHRIAMVRCDGCDIWQHMLCCYDHEDDAKTPQKHWCESCLARSSEDNQLSADFNVLSLEEQSPEHHEHHALANAAREGPQPRFRPFGLPGDYNLFWGPKDGYLQDGLKRCLSCIQRLASPLVKNGFTPKNLLDGLRSQNQVDVVEAVHGGGFTVLLERMMAEQGESKARFDQMILALVANMMVRLVFSDRPPQRDTFEALWLNTILREVFLQNGAEMLQSLKRESLLTIFRGGMDSESLSSVIGQQASDLSAELFGQLSGILSAKSSTRSRKSKPSFSAAAVDAIEEGFAILLDLKYRLLLSDRLYEIYTPKVNSEIKESWMTEETTTFGAKHEKCQLCLMPGLIEYRKDVLKDRAWLAKEFAKVVYLQTSDEERQSGRIASPAIVVLG